MFYDDPLVAPYTPHRIDSSIELAVKHSSEEKQNIQSIKVIFPRHRLYQGWQQRITALRYVARY